MTPSNGQRRWYLDHPMSGPRIAVAPADGVYGIPFNDEHHHGLWVVPAAETDRLRDLADQAYKHLHAGRVGEAMGVLRDMRTPA